MKAIIDRSECIGCGLCTEACPEVFRMGDDDLAEVYAEVDDSLKSSAVEAQDSCPVSAISLEE
ncbi:4Fe-4S dicluster domain-containing protein [Acetobacterium paludosum]|uniref:Ferredoxin n=1 Tax=Acetobacterium paludosum TaxID=52693 RepID=A0A923KX83_9FIRM|nr:ferredoxin [Acetobacterium paludosum]MBC3888993.1 4Fe-4S dicluster domain-containing protein [Acetobacterium paludosum]